MADEMDQDTQREDAIKAVKKSAPEWFGNVFNFLLKDLEYLRTQSKGAEIYWEKCHHNTREIEKLEKELKRLKTQITS